MIGRPVFAASEREKVLFPDPAIPVTRTRRPIAKAASLIDVSVSQVPIGAEQLFASTHAVKRPFRRARFGVSRHAGAHRTPHRTRALSADREAQNGTSCARQPLERALRVRVPNRWKSVEGRLTVPSLGCNDLEHACRKR